MSRAKEYIVGSLLLLIVLLTYGSAVASSEYLAGRANIYMLYHTDESLDGENAIQRQEENNDSEKPLAFTLWGSLENQSVSYQELLRQAPVDITYICGSSRYLFGADTVLEAEDTKGCLVSWDIADKLYGNQKIKGNILTYYGQDYTVRGVLKDVDKTVVLPVDKKTKAVLDAAALSIGDKKENEVLQAYGNRYGGTEKQIKLSTFKDWGKTATGLLFWVIGLVLFIPAGRTAVRLRREPVKCLVWTAAAVLLAVIFWQIGKEYLSVSFKASPPMWSDFSYWKEYFKEKGETLRALMMVGKRAPEQIYVENCVKTLVYTLISGVMLVAGIRKWRLDRLRDVYFYCILSVVVSFAVIFLTKSRALAENFNCWLLLPMYFGISYLLKKMKEKMKSKEPYEIKLLP